MKITSRFVVLSVMLILAIPSRAFALDDRSNFEAVAVDVVIARPLWLVVTVIGTGLFVATLPVSAMSKSVNQTARTLVAKPAQATFTRPLGDFSTLD
ncbi:MAG: hypothetical protein WCF18_20245 [Chthoniobacteraceae bacterium]